MKGDDKKEKMEKNPRIIRAIIETPQGSRNKYAWNEKLKLLELKDNLPLGIHFPYDFGFIPDTLAEDGDPLDILVLTDMPAFPGCIVTGKVIGVIKAEQRETDGRIVENDRIIAVSVQCASLCELRSIRHLNEDLVKQLIDFFIYYERQLGKKFIPKRIAGPGTAMKIINASIEDKKVNDIHNTAFQVKARK